MMPHVPLAEQIHEAERELVWRQEVLPRMVRRKGITRAQAIARLAVQHAIVATLRRVEAEAAQLALFARVEER